MSYLSEVIQVGNLTLGGKSPIRVQSMTNTNTNDIEATVAQCIRLVNAGCEMVRITAQGIKEANQLSLISHSLKSRGISIPLIADIHFNPHAAEVAARIVEKIRINPGNYADTRDSTFIYSDKLYEEELERVASRIRPLLEICSQYGTAIRIGTNHGSLSGRIMSRYGDTPEGMAESALEFGRICRAEGFDKLVFSMKSSNIKVMVQSTRLLVQRMVSEGMHYPMHLGVTEAGDGEDGIIKSAAGIGALLEEKIGDTIRVSLTGAPESEIPVALAITGRYNYSRSESISRPSLPTDKQILTRCESIAVSGIGGSYPVGVIAKKGDNTCLVDEHFTANGSLPDEYLPKVHILKGNASQIRSQFDKIPDDSLFPLILKNTYDTADLLQLRINSAIDMGPNLLDGIGDALWLEAPNIPGELVNQTAFAILQATRSRITHTEFISCPSCGRTLFNLENTLQLVKAATSHLKNLKIAVMGCIVNGPGEMADADYGYMGAGLGLVTLYKGKETVYKNMPENEAIPMLIELIKKSGDWKDKNEDKDPVDYERGK